MAQIKGEGSFSGDQSGAKQAESTPGRNRATQTNWGRLRMSELDVMQTAETVAKNEKISIAKSLHEQHMGRVRTLFSADVTNNPDDLEDLTMLKSDEVLAYLERVAKEKGQAAAQEQAELFLKDYLEGNSGRSILAQEMLDLRVQSQAIAQALTESRFQEFLSIESMAKIVASCDQEQLANLFFFRMNDFFPTFAEKEARFNDDWQQPRLPVIIAPRALNPLAYLLAEWGLSNIALVLKYEGTPFASTCDSFWLAVAAFNLWQTNMGRDCKILLQKLLLTRDEAAVHARAPKLIQEQLPLLPKEQKGYYLATERLRALRKLGGEIDGFRASSSKVKRLDEYTDRGVNALTWRKIDESAIRGVEVAGGVEQQYAQGDLYNTLQAPRNSNERQRAQLEKDLKRLWYDYFGLKPEDFSRLLKQIDSNEFRLELSRFVEHMTPVMIEFGDDQDQKDTHEHRDQFMHPVRHFLYRFFRKLHLQDLERLFENSADLNLKYLIMPMLMLQTIRFVRSDLGEITPLTKVVDGKRVSSRITAQQIFTFLLPKYQELVGDMADIDSSDLLAKAEFPLPERSPEYVQNQTEEAEKRVEGWPVEKGVVSLDRAKRETDLAESIAWLDEYQDYLETEVVPLLVDKGIVVRNWEGYTRRFATGISLIIFSLSFAVTEDAVSLFDAEYPALWYGLITLFLTVGASAISFPYYAANLEDKVGELDPDVFNIITNAHKKIEVEEERLVLKKTQKRRARAFFVRTGGLMLLSLVLAGGMIGGKVDDRLGQGMHAVTGESDLDGGQKSVYDFSGAPESRTKLPLNESSEGDDFRPQGQVFYRGAQEPSFFMRQKCWPTLDAENASLHCGDGSGFGSYEFSTDQIIEVDDLLEASETEADQSTNLVFAKRKGAAFFEIPDGFTPTGAFISGADGPIKIYWHPMFGVRIEGKFKQASIVFSELGQNQLLAEPPEPISPGVYDVLDPAAFEPGGELAHLQPLREELSAEYTKLLAAYDRVLAASPDKAEQWAAWQELIQQPASERGFMTELELNAVIRQSLEARGKGYARVKFRPTAKTATKMQAEIDGQLRFDCEMIDYYEMMMMRSIKAEDGRRPVVYIASGFSSSTTEYRDGRASVGGAASAHDAVIFQTPFGWLVDPATLPGLERDGVSSQETEWVDPESFFNEDTEDSGSGVWEVAKDYSPAMLALMGGAATIGLWHRRRKRAEQRRVRSRDADELANPNQYQSGRRRRRRTQTEPVVAAERVFSPATTPAEPVILEESFVAPATPLTPVAPDVSVSDEVTPQLTPDPVMEMMQAIADLEQGDGISPLAKGLEEKQVVREAHTAFGKFLKETAAEPSRSFIGLFSFQLVTVIEFLGNRERVMYGDNPVPSVVQTPQGEMQTYLFRDLEEHRELMVQSTLDQLRQLDTWNMDDANRAFSLTHKIKEELLGSAENIYAQYQLDPQKLAPYEVGLIDRYEYVVEYLRQLRTALLEEKNADIAGGHTTPWTMGLLTMLEITEAFATAIGAEL